MANRMASLVQVDMDKLSVTKTSWGQQFQDAMNVNGGDLETAKFGHYVGHALSFFWKVSFENHERRQYKMKVYYLQGTLRFCSSHSHGWWLADILCLALLHRCPNSSCR